MSFSTKYLTQNILFRIQSRSYSTIFIRFNNFLFYLTQIAVCYSCVRFLFFFSIKKNQLIGAILVILLFQFQRYPFQGGFVNKIAEQGFFKQYKRVHDILFIISLLVFIFFVSIKFFYLIPNSYIRIVSRI